MKKTIFLAALLSLLATPALAQSYTAKVHKSADQLVVEDGGEVLVKSGGTFTLDPGATFDFEADNPFVTTDIDIGASGTAGTADIFPTTASKGKFRLDALDNAGDYTSTLRNSNIGQATVYSLPECSSSTCDLVAAKGTQTIAGAKTFSTSLKVNATDGTSITAIRFASDTVASGQTAKTTSLTGVTASSKCVATGNEIPTNAAYIKSAAPGTDQVIVTVNTDPGASNLDFTVLCLN